MQLILVGNRGGTNVGSSFWKAAVGLGLHAHLCDAIEAFAAPRWVAAFSWRLRGHRPPHLRRFSQEVVRACQKLQPRWLLSTGLAPIESEALKIIGEMGIKTLNYLTDDPWNPTCRSRWFFHALPFYDTVFSVRRANLADLRRQGCKAVEYLPFGYDPELFYPEIPETAAEKACFLCDVVFAGGADDERIPYIEALIQAGFRLALYGDYWTRYPGTKSHARGHADVRTLRLATRGAKVALCLVRRANRDGHSMRSFEVPAIGACMLAEDTEEHRGIFGKEGKAIVYFRVIEEMIEKLRWLLEHDDERRRLAETARGLIVNGGHTYKDRLAAMLDLVPTDL